MIPLLNSITISRRIFKRGNIVASKFYWVLDTELRPIFGARPAWYFDGCLLIGRRIFVDRLSISDSACASPRRLNWRRVTICSSRTPARIIRETRIIWPTLSNFWVIFQNTSRRPANTRGSSSIKRVRRTNRIEEEPILIHFLVLNV